MVAGTGTFENPLLQVFVGFLYFLCREHFESFPRGNDDN
jgi:hypothetical protein